MSVNRDFYAANAIRTSKDMIELKNRPDLDVFARIKLATSGYADDFLKGAARELYLMLGHDQYGNMNIFQRDGLNNILAELAMPLLPDAFGFMNLSVLNDVHVPFFLIEFNFKLKSSLLTRDEAAHYPVENPVRKDYALKLPVLNSTSWKGLLRNAFLVHHVFPALNKLEKTNADDARLRYFDKRFQMLRLFGTEKEFENSSKNDNTPDFKKEVIEKIYPELSEKDKKEKEIPNLSGSLFSYPTLFNQIEIEMINPHDSLRRVGTQPIHLEMVPSGSEGLFRLFYLQHVPLMLQNVSSEEIAREDLKAVTAAINMLFIESGISAKRTSGKGEVHPKFAIKEGHTGRIVENFLLPKQETQEFNIHPILDFNELTIKGGN